MSKLKIPAITTAQRGSLTLEERELVYDTDRNSVYSGDGSTAGGNEITGNGTVTTVSVTTANGVSGSVANATTTPAITVTLGAITPTTIVASSTVAGSNLSGTNTGDDAGVTSVTGTSPVVSSGGATPAISMAASTASANGYATSTQIAKLDGIAALATANGTVTGSGTTSGTNTGDQTNISGNAATVTTNANLTGHITSTGNAAILGSFTSAQLATALTNETGSGVAVFSTSPTLVTPVLGTPASGTLTNCTFPTLNQDTTGEAADLTGGLGGQIPYQSAANTTAFLANGSSGQVLTSAGTTAAPTWTTNGTGDALTSNPLSQFAATTSAQLAGVLSDETGSGAAVFSTSPTLVTPVLGTPASGALTNCTFPTLNQSTSGNAATVTTNANLTGHVTSVGNAAVLGSFTSAQLATALTNETGSGSAVFATSPTFITPVLGTPTSGTLTNCTFPTFNQNTTGNATTATTSTNIAGGLGGQVPYQSAAGTTSLLANGTAGQVLQSNGTTLAPTWAAAGTGDALVANPLSQFAATTSAQLAGVISDETGSGALVFATSPTLVTPTLGVATATSVTSSGFVGTGATEAIKLPVGTTAQQPTAATGMLRFNSTDTSFEGYDGSAWGAIGGSAANEGFTVNINAVAADYTLATNSNASSVGPMTVNTGVTVTIPTGSRWLIL